MAANLKKYYESKKEEKTDEEIEKEVVYRVALIVALLDGEEIADGLIDCLGEAAVRLGGEHFYKRPRELFEDDGDKIIRIKDKQSAAYAFAVLVFA